MKKTAIEYARKSIQVRGYENERDSVLYQLGRIKKYADENDYEIIESFSDIGYSGVLKSRPELNRMLEFLKCREEKVHALILYNSDRLARDLSTSIELMLEITELVEEVIFVVSELRSSVKHFRERFLIEAARHAEERRSLKSRLRFAREIIVSESHYYRSTHKPLGLIQKKKKELVLGTINNTRDLEIHKDLLIVQSIFLGYLTGMSFRKIAKWVTQTYGLTKRGTAWDHSSIRHILKNPVYAGILSGVFMEGQEIGPVETIEPLVSLPLFKYVQVKTENETSGNKSKILKSLPDLTMCAGCFFPLQIRSGQLVCLKCNHALEVQTYVSLARGEFVKLLHGEAMNDNIESLLNERKHILSLNLFTLKDKLDSLVRRENELYKVFSNNKDKIMTLVSINRKDQDKIRKKIVLEQAFYDFLFAKDKEVTHIEIPELAEGLIALPYLIFVDFETKTLEVKFHEKIFKGVNYESGKLKMVNENIRLLTDFG